MNLDEVYATNRIAIDHLRRIGLGWETHSHLSLIGEALMQEHWALDELIKLHQAIHLVIAQFAEIKDSAWPTRGMKAAIARLEEVVTMEDHPWYVQQEENRKEECVPMEDTQLTLTAQHGRPHYGDPCVFCDASHDEVDVGPFPGRVGLDRDADRALTIDKLIEQLEDLKQMVDFIRFLVCAPQQRGRVAESIRLRVEELTQPRLGYYVKGEDKEPVPEETREPVAPLSISKDEIHALHVAALVLQEYAKVSDPDGEWLPLTIEKTARELDAVARRINRAQNGNWQE